MLFTYINFHVILLLGFLEREKKKKRGIPGESNRKVTLHTQLAKYLFNLKDTTSKGNIYIEENKVSSLKSILFHDRFSHQPVYLSIFSIISLVTHEYAFRIRCRFHSSLNTTLLGKCA